MQEAMQKTLAALWDERDGDLPLRSTEELVTFASIVERETGRVDERDRVAAVFYNRLKKGMRLQSDPTIIYGLVGGQGMLGRGITKADIEAKSPYNTYQINGLPPGPICNPGQVRSAGGVASRQDRGSVFRCRRQRRPRVFRDAERAQFSRPEMAWRREAGEGKAGCGRGR